MREARVGTLLFEEGQPGHSAFLVLKGRIAVRRRIGDEETALIALRGPLEWVGEMALLEDGNRCASTVAQDDLRVLEVPREVFLEVLARHGEAGLDLLRCVSERLRESDAVLIEAIRKQRGTLVSANRRLRRENQTLRRYWAQEEVGFDDFVGSSDRAKRVRARRRWKPPGASQPRGEPAPLPPVAGDAGLALSLGTGALALSEIYVPQDLRAHDDVLSLLDAAQAKSS